MERRVMADEPKAAPMVRCELCVATREPATWVEAGEVLRHFADRHPEWAAALETLRADPELAAQVLGGAGPLTATRATIRRCTTQGDPQ
jgi:hypothetical protein